MSSTKLREMMDYIESYHYIIHGILVVWGGYIVWEEYPYAGYDVDTLHLLYSVTKSFTSCLTGIAIDQGYIGGVSERMISFFPNRTVENLEGGKELITLENLLMMRSGMFWDESSAPYNSPDNGIYHINREDGLIVCFDDRSRVQIRSSNTEPILRVRSEATSGEKAERLVEDAVSRIRQCT